MFLTVTSLKFVLLQYGFCLSTLIFWYGKFSSFLRWFYTKYLKNKMQTKNLQINLSYCRNPNTPDSHFACWLCCFCLFHSLAFFPSVSVLLSLFVLQHNSAFRADRALQRNSLAERSFCTLSLSIRSLMWQKSTRVQICRRVRDEWIVTASTGKLQIQRNFW